MLNEKLITAATTGDWSKIDISSITEDVLKESDAELKRNIFHIAAVSEKLDKIPKDLWDNDLLLKTDIHQNTVLHLATSKEQFHLIPKEIINQKTILKRNCMGWSVLAHVAIHSPLTILPKHLLTEENFAQKGSCCLGYTMRFLGSDYKDQKMLKNNIRIIISTLSENELKQQLENCHEKEIIPKMKEYIDKELNKRKILSKIKTNNYIEI